MPGPYYSFGLCFMSIIFGWTTSASTNATTTLQMSNVLTDCLAEKYFNKSSQTSWLKLAKFYSTCISEHPPSNSSSSDEANTCLNSNCMECIRPCTFHWVESSECEKKCGNGSEICKQGCDLVVDLFTLAPSPENPNAPSEIESAPTVTADNKIQWKASNTSINPVVYVVSGKLAEPGQSKGDMKNLGLAVTPTTQFEFELKQICKYGIKIFHNTSVSYNVVPVNQYGWGASTDVPQSSPQALMKDEIETTNLRVSLPWKYESIVDSTGKKIDRVKLQIKWDFPNDIKDMFHHVSLFNRLGIKYNATYELNTGTISIENDKADSLAGVIVSISISPMKDCYVGKDKTLLVPYHGCFTLGDYPKNYTCVESTTATPARTYPIASTNSTVIPPSNKTDNGTTGTGKGDKGKDKDDEDDGLSGGAIAGIIIGILLLIIIIVIIVVFILKKRKEDAKSSEPEPLMVAYTSKDAKD